MDVGFQKFKARDRIDKSLNAHDIDGTAPYLRSYRYTNKPDFINKKDDIRGASPRHLIKNRDHVVFLENVSSFLLGSISLQRRHQGFPSVDE